MDGEDLCGWLVPFGMADFFEQKWLDSDESLDDEYIDLYAFACWQRSTDGGTVTVSFS